MKRFLPILITVAASLSPVYTARAGLVVMSPDTLWTGCDVLDNVVGSRSFYLLHIAGPGAVSGVRFRLEASAGMTMTYVSEVHYAPTLIGDTQSGITFCYSSCAPNYVRVTYMAYGTSEECSEIRVVPHPDSNTIDELLCDGQSSNAGGGIFFVNNCGSEPPCPWVDYGPPNVPYESCLPVGTELTTWGAIKSLYR